MLKKRFISAFCVLPVLIAAILFEHPVPWLTIFIAGWGALAVFEFYHITGSDKPLLSVLGITLTVLFIISPHIPDPTFLPAVMTFGLIVPLIVLLTYRKSLFIGWAWMVAGALYIGWLLRYYVAMRSLDDGRYWVLLVLLTVFAFDTAAFFVGRAIGRRRLAPRVSPGKTWEGTIAGAVAALAAAVGLSFAVGLPISWWEAALLGFIVAIFGQIGDLVESLLKRSTGVKDSGRLMPGHGGILDRTDSVAFVGPLVYYYIVWVVL